MNESESVQPAMTAHAEDKTIRVWDPIVRIGHWTIVLAFFTAYFTEDELLAQHVWAGYVVGAAVLIRMIWGFVGSEHARFRDFIHAPGTTLRYLVDIVRNRAKRYLGHNPAGGAMIAVLLFCLGGIVYSGLMVLAYEEKSGPFAGWVASSVVVATAPGDENATGAHVDAAYEQAEHFWEETHVILANLTLILVGLHVAGVLLASRSHRENLVRSMITGRKRRGD